MSESARIGGNLAHWRTFGTGPRPALALHCSLARARAWSGLAAMLEDKLTVTALDLPGHGQSGDWDSERPYLDQVMPVIEALAGDAPVDFLGHSFGAVLALAFAVKWPARVRSLMLYEPVLFAAAERAGRPEMTVNHEQMAPFRKALAADDPAAAARTFTGIWGTGQEWEGLPADQRKYLIDRIGLIAAGDPLLIDDAGGILQPGALESLTCPVLFIRGSKSPPVTGAIIDCLAPRIADATSAVIEGARHMGPISRPADVAAAIRPFLART